MTPENVKLAYAAMLALLALSLMGCAHNSPTPPAELPQLPPPPSLSTPLPSVTYSATAADVIKSWASKLTATQMMSEPSLKPGQ